jgi:hypothetical protein
MAVFDTLEFAWTLEGAGVPREKAEAFSLTFNEALMDSANKGLPMQSMNEKQLADLTIKIMKLCGLPLRETY